MHYVGSELYYLHICLIVDLGTILNYYTHLRRNMEGRGSTVQQMCRDSNIIIIGVVNIMVIECVVQWVLNSVRVLRTCIYTL